MRFRELASASVLSLAVAACHSGTSAADEPTGNGDAGNGDATDGDAGNGDAGNRDATDGDAGNGDAGNDAGNGDTGNDAGSDAAIPGSPIEIGADGGTVLGMSISPLALTPAFGPAVTDYYVACSAGDNALTLNVTYSSGSESYALDVAENQAVVVAGTYWIRCLPHDFPPITVTQNPDAGGPTPGYYLVNSLTYAVVLDTNGVPVWYENGSTVLNVNSPAPDTLSFMLNENDPFGENPAAVFDILDLDNLSRTTVVPPNGPADAHELLTVPDGSQYTFTFPIESGVDLSGLPNLSSSENMADCEIDQLDSTGNLVWSWLASDHVDPNLESLEPLSQPINGETVIDVFHCNSIDVDGQGNLLVSMRETNAVFYISKSTGQVLWKLGGTPYSKDGATLIPTVGDPETTFSMQHDARFQPNGDVSLFDDHGAAPGAARGVEYAIDVNANTATVDWQFLGTAQSLYEGSFRRYADGESVIGWGYIPTDPRVVTEVDSNGNDVLDIAFGSASQTAGQTNQTYRAVKVPLSQLDVGVLRRTAGQ